MAAIALSYWTGAVQIVRMKSVSVSVGGTRFGETGPTFGHSPKPVPRLESQI